MVFFNFSDQKKQMTTELFKYVNGILIVKAADWTIFLTCVVSVSEQKVTVTSSFVPLSPILTTISLIFASKHKSEPNVLHFSEKKMYLNLNYLLEYNTISCVIL